MKNFNFLKLVVFLALPFFQLQAQTIISSLSELLATTDQNNVNVKMTPGTYYFNTDNCGSGKLFSEATLLLFTGSNSTYDFTGVIFEYDTDIFKVYGSVEVLEFQVVGNNNSFYNLTMEDIGDTPPQKTALALSIDGEDNLYEGFHVTTRGSYPYGYGDIFGKGSARVISHRKHGALQFRGKRNHAKNCTFILRSYGHGIFIQGAEDALIEGCYVEGELNTTDAVLAEVGTGSPADDVGFMTVWGYTLQPGWIFSCQEDGIRSYSSGCIYGVDCSQTSTTNNVRVIDCTVKNMRSGVTIGLGNGTKYVENTTAIGTESGFWVGSGGNVINCKGDASVGPLYSEDRASNNTNIDLTLIDGDIARYGNTPTMYFAGSNHDITIKDGTISFDSEIEILVGGTRFGHRWLEGSGEEPPFFDASGITLNNMTNYPITLGVNSYDNDITTCESVTDNGSNNTITITDECGPIECKTHDAFSVIQAEDFCDQSNVVVTDSNALGYIQNGSWVKYEGVNFGDGVASITASVSSGNAGGEIEIRLDSTSGDLLGTIEVPNTGSWTEWETHSENIESVTGEQDIYLVFTGGTGYLLDVDWFQFSNQTLSNDELTFLNVSKVNIYPNPVSTITILKNAENSTLNVYDMNGRLVFTQIISSESETVKLSDIAPGMYYGKITAEKDSAVLKIIKD